MAKAITTSGRLDERGRLSVPADIRKALGVGPGDTVFLKYEPRENKVYITPALNPFDVLAERAIQEYQAGQTRTIEKFRIVTNPDFEWFQKNYRSLKKDYEDQWIAIANGSVVSHGDNAANVCAAARHKGIKRPFITRVSPRSWEG